MFGAVVDALKAETNDAADTNFDAVNEIVAEKNLLNTPHNYRLLQTEEEIRDLIRTLQGQKEISFNTETNCPDPNDCELIGMSFSSAKREGYYIKFPSNRPDAEKLLEQLAPLFADEAITWVGHNLKTDILVMKWYGYELKGKTFDTLLAHYVIDPDGLRSMDNLSNQYLRYEPIHLEDLIGKKGRNQGNIKDVAIEKVKDYSAEDADLTLQLQHCFTPLLKTKKG